MRVALLTNYLTSYRVPLYERLARGHGVEVLCFARVGCAARALRWVWRGATTP